MIDGVPEFELFGTQHWVATAITVGAAVIVPLVVQRLTAERQEFARKALTICLVVYLLAAPVIRAGIYDLPLRDHLPLHLCGISVILGILLLWRRSYRIYEVVYFWAAGGTLAAILTPDVEAGFPHPLFLLFFIGHGLALIPIVFATVIFGFRPRLKSVGISLMAAAVYALLIFPVNLILGSNYLYLTHKPDGASPIDYLGPWPWYIFGLCGAAVVLCLLLYLPFARFSLTSSKRLQGN